MSHAHLFASITLFCHFEPQQICQTKQNPKCIALISILCNALPVMSQASLAKHLLQLLPKDKPTAYDMGSPRKFSHTTFLVVLLLILCVCTCERNNSNHNCSTLLCVSENDLHWICNKLLWTLKSQLLPSDATGQYARSDVMFFSVQANDVVHTCRPMRTASTNFERSCGQQPKITQRFQNPGFW